MALMYVCGSRLVSLRSLKEPPPLNVLVVPVYLGGGGGVLVKAEVPLPYARGEFPKKEGIVACNRNLRVGF